MHLEYVIAGVPISNQSGSGTALPTWRATVEAAVRKAWAYPPLSGELRVVVINFHKGEKPTLDLDNMSKPILDVMQEIVYDDDRQVRQAELAHVRIVAPLVFVGVSKLIVTAVQAGNDFVYVRIEDAVAPYPLPT